MVWKVINIADVGTTQKFGGDDMDKVSRLFSATDVDDVDINLDWTYRSGKLNLRNPANTFSYNIVSAALAANRTLSLPLLTANSTLAVLDLAQIFSEPQEIKKDSETLFKLTRDTNTEDADWGAEFWAKDSIGGFVDYAEIKANIENNDTGAVDGLLSFNINEDGVMARKMYINSTDFAITQSGVNFVILRNTGLTADRAYTFPDIDTTMVGTIGNQTISGVKTFTDQAIKLRNPANTFSYTLVHGAIAADRTLNLPVTTATDTLATLGLAQTFTQQQIIKKDASTLLTLYRDTNTDESEWQLNFDGKDSTNADTTYARIRTKMSDPVNGSEDGVFFIDAIKEGTLTNYFYVDAGGFSFSRSGSNYGIFRNDLLSGDRAYQFPDVTGGAGGSDGRLKVQAHDYFEVEDEFSCGSISLTNTSNQIGVLNWGISNSTGGTPTVTAGVANHPGIVTITTGATSGNNCRMHLTDTASTAFCVPTDIERYAWIVRIPTITSIIVRVGLMQDVSAASGGTAGAFFQFSSAVDADNWQSITRQASTSTTNTITGVTVDANDWFLLEAVRLSGGNWEFYVNNTLQFTHSANLPTTACNIGVHTETATTAARPLDIDYFKLRTIKLGQRWT